MPLIQERFLTEEQKKELVEKIIILETIDERFIRREIAKAGLRIPVNETPLGFFALNTPLDVIKQIQIEYRDGGRVTSFLYGLSENNITLIKEFIENYGINALPDSYEKLVLLKDDVEISKESIKFRFTYTSQRTKSISGMIKEQAEQLIYYPIYTPCAKLYTDIGLLEIRTTEASIATLVSRYFIDAFKIMPPKITFNEDELLLWIKLAGSVSHIRVRIEARLTEEDLAAASVGLTADRDMVKGAQILKDSLFKDAIKRGRITYEHVTLTGEVKNTPIEITIKINGIEGKINFSSYVGESEIEYVLRNVPKIREVYRS